MAKKPSRMWVYAPKKTAPKVPAAFKAETQAKVEQWIAAVLKPKYIKPPPAEPRFNYLVDIQARWHRHWFYVVGIYRCPPPNAITPEFEEKFARLECVALDRFNLSYFRHTGQWWELYQDLSLQECMARIEDGPHFIVV